LVAWQFGAHAATAGGMNEGRTNLVVDLRDWPAICQVTLSKPGGVTSPPHHDPNDKLLLAFLILFRVVVDSKDEGLANPQATTVAREVTRSLLPF
jgi:hypothetical protein